MLGVLIPSIKCKGDINGFNYFGRHYGRNINSGSLVNWVNMTIKAKAKKVVSKVDEVIVKTDSATDRLLNLIKSSKRSILIVVVIIVFIIWLT